MARFLIVDDDASIRALFEFVALEAGHEVSVAGDGAEALRAVEAAVPDFIVLDVDMPVMSGREFIERLKRLALTRPELGAIPFLVMTGENFMEKGLNGVFASHKGFVCFFPKMTPPETVLARAEEALAAGG